MKPSNSTTPLLQLDWLEGKGFELGVVCQAGREIELGCNFARCILDVLR